MPEHKKPKHASFRLDEDGRLGLPEHDFSLRGREFPKENADFEITFYEGIVQRNPYNEDALMFLGHAYTAREQFTKGLEVDRRLVRLRPNDPVAFYNLACSLSLLEKRDEAVKALRQAIELGYDDLDYMMRDSHLDNVRRDRRFRLLVNRLKRLAARRR